MKKYKFILLSINMVCLCLSSYSQKWDILGNGGTSSATNFVGTTDNNPLQFGTNGAFPQMVLAKN